MKYKDNQVTDLQIAYIGGGSRGWAWSLMGDLAVEEQLSGEVRLYDIDFDAALNNERIGNRLSQREDVKGKWHYKAVRSLKEALTGADFVVISILPGTFDEMASDVHAPEKYGIYQSVGDTTGPGGLVRALRTIPMYVEIAEAIRAYSPKAWVINYTNPMSLCVKTLYTVFPEIKAFGCCHEVFSTQELLADMLGEMKRIPNIPRQDIKINVLGINHFTWIDHASYQGMDLFPLYREFVDRHYDEGYEKENGEHWMNSYFSCAHRVKFDLFRRFGLIAAAGDRHLAEFVPPWYLKDPETVRKWKFSLTPVSWRVEHRQKLMEKSEALAAGLEEVTLKASGEEGIQQIKALLGLGDMVTNVNLPNRGQIGNLPAGAIVETNALFTRDSIRPVMAGNLPSDVQRLIIGHVINHEMILKAALTRDKALAYKAFINDPLVTIDLEKSAELFDQMLLNTRKYLPGWDL